jgi:hypothetical protein
MQLGDKTAFGLAGFGGSLAVVGMSVEHIYPNAPIWAWDVLFWLGLVGLAASLVYLIYLHSDFVQKHFLKAIWFGVGGIVVGSGIYLLFIRTSDPEVYGPFRLAYDTYRIAHDLGSPTSTVMPTSGERSDTPIYQGEYRGGLVFWLAALQRIYVLPLNFNDQKWFDQISPVVDQTWCDEDFVRKQIRGLSPKKKPPICNVAKHWQAEPQKWSQLDENVWDCFLDPASVKYQYFGSTMILGLFRDGETTDNGTVFLLFSDHSWAINQSASKATPCKKPPGRH